MDSTVTEPPTKKKTKLPQGKIDREKLFRLFTQDVPPKKKDMAVLCGSLATTDEGKIQTVSEAINSPKFQERLAEHREEQRVRSLNRVAKAEAELDYTAMAENQGVLGSFIIANERILSENLKQETDKKEGGKVRNIFISSPTPELMNELEKLSKQKVVIEGEIST